MNPIVWLFIVAPAAALAALLFVWVYQDNTERADLERERSRVERQQFDQDFANAWNGERIEAPAAEDLQKGRDRVAVLEARKEAREQESGERMQALAKELETTITTGDK